MARILKEDEYNAKRNEILDAALGLVYSKGYEQMTIQDVLDGTKISKGAFYHYFDSKEALLNALVERMGSEAERTILLIVQDPSLPAIEKFQRYCEASARWKAGQKELIINLLEVWYGEGNALIRQRMAVKSMESVSRFLDPIIRQGVEEKAFRTRFPEQAAGIVTGVILNAADSLVGLMLSPKFDRETLEKMDTLMNAYTEAVERILGAPTGSLKIFEPGAFDDWLPALQARHTAE